MAMWIKNLPDNHSVLQSERTSDHDDGGEGEAGEQEQQEEEEGRRGARWGRWRWSRGGGGGWRGARGVLGDNPLLLPVLVPASHPVKEKVSFKEKESRRNLNVYCVQGLRPSILAVTSTYIPHSYTFGFLLIFHLSGHLRQEVRPGQGVSGCFDNRPEKNWIKAKKYMCTGSLKITTFFCALNINRFLIF